MADNIPQDPPNVIPRFIQSQLKSPPISPGESADEFRSLFGELGQSYQAGHRTAAEYAMLLQATTLIFRAIGLERIRVAIIQHNRPAAVATLLRRTHEHGEAERGSIAFHTANAQRIDYFTSKEGKKQVEAQFANAGYAPDAVDVEAFQLALPSLATIDRQINTAQKQLMAFLKEIERRDSKRAEALRKAASSAISRGRSRVSEAREAS